MQELSNFIEKQPTEETIKKDEESEERDQRESFSTDKPIQPKFKTLSFRQSTFKSKTNNTTEFSKSLTFEPQQDDKRSSKYDRYAFGSNGTHTPTKTRSKLIESEGKRMENAILKAPQACHSILKVILF